MMTNNEKANENGSLNTTNNNTSTSLKEKEDDTKALNQEQNNRKEKEAEMALDKKTPPSLDRNHLLLGFAFAISAAFLFAMSNVLMKKANFFNGSEKALVKLGIQLVVIILVLFYIKESFLGPKIARLYLFLRGLFGVGHFISLVYAVGLIAPSDLISLNRASIILVTIASRFVFKEKLNFTHILAIVLTISGVFLLCQPTFIFGERKTAKVEREWEKFMFGIFLGLVACFTEAVAIIYAKKISDLNINPVINPSYVAYLGVPISLSITLGVDLTESKSTRPVLESSDLAIQIVLVVLGAVSMILYQICLALALKYGDASKISIIMATDLLFAFLFQYEILGIVSKWDAIVGAVLILLGTLMITIYKLLDKGEKPSSCFEKFICYKF